MRYQLNEKTNFYDVNHYKYLTKKLEKKLKTYRLMEHFYLKYEKKVKSITNENKLLLRWNW